MRRRIVALTLGAAGLALLLFGAPLAIGLGQFASTEERIVLQQVAESTAWSIQDRMAHGGVPTSLPAAPPGMTVALYAPTGVLLTGQGPPTAAPSVSLSTDPVTGWGAPEGLVVSAPVSGTHDVVGFVRVAGNPGSVYTSLVPWWLGMVALAGLVLLAVWLVARRQARRLSSPLENLAADAERLGKGDFSVRPAVAGIAEVDHVVEALDTTARRLDDMLARERAFTAEVSHQLRTPLTGVRLRLEAALEGPEDAARLAIETGLVSVDRLERTIDDLLLLARRRPDHPVVTDVGVLLRAAEREWAGQFAAVGRGLEVRTADETPPVTASGAATRQVLGVLLDNARVHGSGRVLVALREIDETAVAIDVSDEGDGVEHGTLASLARPGSRPASSAPGHGMGLALAQRLATAEGGRLVVKARGTVSFLLPVHRDESPEADGTPAGDPVASAPRSDADRSGTAPPAVVGGRGPTTSRTGWRTSGPAPSP